MENVLELHGLCKTYPAFQLKQVSFSVERGTIMGFVGRNGAGKTTTMKSILNLVHPDAGEILLFGKSFLKAEDEIKKRIGYASGGTHYYPRKTLGKICSVAKSFYDNWDDRLLRDYLERFSLDPKKKIIELSEGMRAKFHLALAMSHHAEFLILDEPTSGLDPVSREELVRIFRQLAAEGVTILFSTHITADLEKCADTVTYIKNGAILASKPLEEFRADYAETCQTLDDIMVHIELDERGNRE